MILARVPHHLIDITPAGSSYHAGQFLRDIERVLHEIHARGRRALIVGGSGFYLKALRLGSVGSTRHLARVSPRCPD